MPATIKCSWKGLKDATGLDGVECIAVAHLGKYGFSDDIINQMVKFDIFPQTYLICGMVYVARDAIFLGVVRSLLDNAMTLYQGVADLDANAEKVSKYIEENAVKVEVAEVTE